MARGQPEVGAEGIGQCGAEAKAGGAQPPSGSSSHLPQAASGSRSNLGYLQTPGILVFLHATLNL